MVIISMNYMKCMWRDKMSKNGFTLVELLAVVVVLGLISLLTVPVVDRILRDNREKANDVNVDTILNAAYDYVQQNPSNIPDNTDGAVTTFTLTDLINSGLIKSDITNPKTNAPYSGESTITVTFKREAPNPMPEDSKFFGNYLFTFNAK